MNITTFPPGASYFLRKKPRFRGFHSFPPAMSKAGAVLRQKPQRKSLPEEYSQTPMTLPRARHITLAALRTKGLTNVESELLLQTLQLVLTPLPRLGTNPIAWSARTMLAVSLHYTTSTVAAYYRMSETRLAARLHAAAEVHANVINWQGDDVRAVCAEYLSRHRKTEKLLIRVRCCTRLGNIRCTFEATRRCREQMEARKDQGLGKRLRKLENGPASSAEQARRGTRRAESRKRTTMRRKNLLVGEEERDGQEGTLSGTGAREAIVTQHWVLDLFMRLRMMKAKW
ncbi:hypothetical protein LTR95_000745 [Oleoguttula sp. CCFEE 5521]